jgi:hypothetical protein
MTNEFKRTRDNCFLPKLGIIDDEVPIEQLDHYIAVENYLKDDEELPPEATN